MPTNSVAAPLPADEIVAALVRAGSPWRDVTCLGVTGSTNADLAATPGAPEGTVVVADLQTAGRGRLGRSWVAPPGTALTFSALLRPPPIDPARWSWIPLLVGLGVRAAVTEVTGLRADLKWPNDLLLGESKFCGILCEVVGDAVVAGVGINVSVAVADLPTSDATSLQLTGAANVSRPDLLASVLREIANRMSSWREQGGDPAELRAEYVAACATIGRHVRLQTPGGQVFGSAADVDDLGRLVVNGTAYAAGDVTHVRPG